MEIVIQSHGVVVLITWWHLYKRRIHSWNGFWLLRALVLMRNQATVVILKMQGMGLHTRLRVKSKLPRLRTIQPLSIIRNYMCSEDMMEKRIIATSDCLTQRLFSGWKLKDLEVTLLMEEMDIQPHSSVSNIIAQFCFSDHKLFIIGGWLGQGPLAADDMHVLDL